MRFGFFHESDTRQQASRWSMTCTGWNAYLLISMILLLFFIGSYILTLYTPWLQWIGADTDQPSDEMRQIAQEVDEMNTRLEAQSLYIKHLQKRIQGGQVEFDSSSIDTSDPVNTTLTVKRIALDDTLRKKVLQNSVQLPVRTPLLLETEADDSSTELSDHIMASPIRGSVLKTFDALQQHYGIDVIAPANSAVKSILDGHVIESDWSLEGGNTMIIQHSHQLVSVYKHNSALLKKKGDTVKAGEAIAIIGNTGLHSDGPHVHFELWYKGQPINPASYISFSSE